MDADNFCHLNLTANLPILNSVASRDSLLNMQKERGEIFLMKGSALSANIIFIKYFQEQN